MSFTSEQEEYNWWTPDELIAAVKDVMPSIDLDPASCAEANKRIGAARFYTEQDDALAQHWQAKNLYCLPPFHSRAAFADTLIEHYINNDVTRAIFVMVAETDAEWAQALMRMSTAVCFLKGLTRYHDGDTGKPAEMTAPQAQMVFYLGGGGAAKFCQSFDDVHDLGVCYLL